MTVFDTAEVLAVIGSADGATEQQIRHLVALASILTDRGDLAGFEALLDDGVVWQMPGDRAEGAATVIAGMTARRTANVTGPDSATKHVVTTLCVYLVSKGEARAESTWTSPADTRPTPRVVGTGRYFDSFRRGPDGRWRFVQRVSQRG